MQYINAELQRRMRQALNLTGIHWRLHKVELENFLVRALINSHTELNRTKGYGNPWLHQFRKEICKILKIWTFLKNNEIVNIRDLAQHVFQHHHLLPNYIRSMLVPTKKKTSPDFGLQNRLSIKMKVDGPWSRWSCDIQEWTFLS